jgi:oligosaccharide reducing-end xylanase
LPSREPSPRTVGSKGSRGTGSVTSVVALALAVAAAGTGCHSTVDSLGYDDASGIVLHRMTGPASGYINAFRDVLGKSDAEIADKIALAFETLFHGDATKAFYVPVPGQEDQAYIQDTYHGDRRTEGLGLGMLIAVELDKRAEFDHLWTYAKAMPLQSSGAARGYFLSSCAPAPSTPPCLDPYGMQYLLMALLLANDQWQVAAGGPDYAAGARDLLTVMRHKEDENGGVSNGVTDVFDDSTGLVFDLPSATLNGQTRPSIELPAFYDRWAEATGDPFWTRAASSARAFWQAAANAKTGLVPLRARFDGTPVPGADTFSPETFRTEVNLVLDGIWSPGHPWDAEEADRLLQFFIGKGMNTYGREFTLDGTTVDSMHDPSLVVMNGAMALIAGVDQRKAFIDEVWNLDLPVGPSRYFTGIFQMMSLLILSGQCRIL